jgi:surface protein
MKHLQTKANFRFTLLLILIFAVTYNLKSQSFITEWHFPTATNQLSFNAITTDTVNYHWLAKPSGNTGSGQINSGAVTIPINVLANDSLTLTLTHANLRSFTINSGPNKDNLVNVKQWGDAPWNYLEYAFAGCSKLQISALDTPDLSNVVSLFSMFFQATNFNSPVEHWNTSNITNMRSVFNNAQSFNQPIGKWNTSNVTTMTRMFLSAKNFNKPLNNWNTVNVIDMSSMFSGATNFNDSIGNWNTINVTNMSSMFSSATNFNQPIGSWNTSNVTNISSMFSEAINFNKPIGTWNTENVTNMSLMFSGATNFNQTLENWNTSKTTDMFFLFNNATNFNQPIGSWDVSKVTFMSGMFSGATNFNKPIDNWNTINVTSMNSMFSSSTNFNQPIGNWNTEKVTQFFDMFENATNFNQPIGNWNTSNAIEMNSMFENANAFNQSISNWDVSKVTNMRSMFASANLFNQPLYGWNTSSLVDASNMFKNALAFNQNLGNWNLSSVTNLTDMLNFSGVSCEKYDSTLIGWANNPLIPQNLILGAYGKKYWQSNTHRNYMITVKNWQIIGDAFSLNCEDLVTPNSNKEFITKWHFPQSTNTVFFNVSGTGPIAYSWVAKPSGNSGVGIINGPVNQVTININQNDSVNIHFSPQNLRSFTIDNGPNQSMLSNGAGCLGNRLKICFLGVRIFELQL